MIQDYGDPFDWKFPSRNDTMSLQTINKKDAGFQVYEAKELRRACLNPSDIRGASPELKPYKFTNKETYINRLNDINGSQPKSLNRFLEKESFVLKNEDIKGTKTKVFAFETTRQDTNPLQPSYKLPQVQQRLSTPPKFLRDNLDITDIEGTRPMPKVFKPRKEDIYTEIEGSKPRERFIPKQHIDSLKVEDINQYKRFISTRETNPLQPTYGVPTEKSGYNEYSIYVDPTNYGKIKGTESKRLHPVESTKENFNLKVRDIKGASADTFTDNFLKREQRKDFRTTNITKDMPWANASSLKKGIQTIRSVNPLTPTYDLLGAKEEQQERLKELMATTNLPQTTKAISQSSKQQSDQQQQQVKRDSVSSYMSNNKNKRPSIQSQASVSNKSQQGQTGNQIIRGGSQHQSRRSSDNSQINYAQTQANFRPPKPSYDTLGNKIEIVTQKQNQDTQYCETHKKNEPAVRNGLTSSKTVSNLSKAQKLDKFVC